ncbi:MAG: NAD(P)/FAD-dependent oxidoreductase [bacterium]|nr:NAD(P)/FAD-dependent oxidoreductase [bacterium]
MAEDVLVIGAGPAGLASAYFLEANDISYRVVDWASVIASTWDSLYPSLRLNTTRFFSHLPGLRFPLHNGIFPTGRQYHRYLVRYARRNRFNIHLGVTVHHIQPEGDGWRVESSEGSAWYRAVISATGRFNSPYIPSIPGMRDFDGTLIHANDYRAPEPFIGKRVMVVGNGPSGCDIATELGHYAASPVLFAQRTGVVLRPRYPYGLPKHVWMMIDEHVPLLRPLAKRAQAKAFRDLDKLGIKTPPPGLASSAAGGARGWELIKAVKAGNVQPVDAPVRFYAHEVEVQGGSRYPVDAVIMGTGYRPVLYQYFDYDGPTVEYDWPQRDCSQVPNGREVVGYPGLYLVGVFYQGKGAMYNFAVEAQIAVEQIKARLGQR